MKICDICRTEGVHYTTYVTIDEDGTGRKLELCSSCYRKLHQNTQHHAYLAYQETLAEITGEMPKKKSWWGKFKK